MKSIKENLVLKNSYRKETVEISTVSEDTAYPWYSIRPGFFTTFLIGFLALCGFFFTVLYMYVYYPVALFVTIFFLVNGYLYYIVSEATGIPVVPLIFLKEFISSRFKD